MEEVAVAPLFLLPWSLLPQKLHLLLFEPFLKKKRTRRRREGRGGGLKRNTSGLPLTYSVGNENSNAVTEGVVGPSHLGSVEQEIANHVTSCDLM